MGSTRLPGKVLRPIAGKPLLEHILFRLSFLQHAATIVIATTDSPRDAVVAEFCKDRGVECFRGSETNVLDRYARCAKHYAFDQIVRLTADNPFTDIARLDDLIDMHERSKSDFSHSFGVLPVGGGAEIFTIHALEKCRRESTAAHHFEHVDEYMLEHPELFKTSLLPARQGEMHAAVRLTVDTEEDYRKACFIMEHASGQYVSTGEAVALCLRFA